MNLWTYAKTFLTWLWRGLRAWLEIGSRLGQIEQDMHEQASVNKREIEQVQSAITAVAESERSSFEHVRQRLESLERKQGEQMASLERTLQNRVDEWARQLSGQMTQLYAAVAQNPIEIRKR